MQHHPTNAGERPGADVTRELGAIFNPLCAAVAEGVVAQRHTEAGRALAERIHALPRHVLPNSEHTTHVPWDTFVDIDEATMRSAPAEVSRDFDTWYSLKQTISDGYVRRHPELEAINDIFPHSDVLEVEHVAEGALLGLPMLERIDDPAAWKRFEQYVASQKPDEQRNITEMFKHRKTNISKSPYKDDRLKQVNTFLYAKNPFVADHFATSHIVVPVGEYGEVFSNDILETTVALEAYAEENVRNMAAEVTADNEELLLTYTARAADAGEATADTTMLTLQEGNVSVMHAKILLTMEKVDGYDDPHKLSQDLTKSGLIERLARYSSMGLTGPMVLNGSYFPGAVERTETGLKFSDEFEAFLKENRAMYVAKYVLKQSVKAGPASVHDKKYSLPVGRICPAAGRGAGVEQISAAADTLMMEPAGPPQST